MTKNDTSTYCEIKPAKGLIKIDFPEIWRFRELFYIIVWRDIKVRYRQTILGILWAMLAPFVTMVIFTFLFDRLTKVPSEGVPYPIFVYSGLLLWNYFSSAITNASNSLVNDEAIIKKVYFPRLILPIAAALTPTVDFLFSLIVLSGLMIYFRFVPFWLGFVMIFPLLLISFIGASGVGILLASINVKYRDVRYVVPYFVQILMFLTPVIYPVSVIPQKFQWILYLNPMAGVITAARASLLHTRPVDWTILLLSLVIGLILLFLGIAYFRKTERFFADIL